MIDFDAIKPKATDVPRMQRGPRDTGPNKWLDRDWEYGLVACYDQNTAFTAPFPGKIESVPLVKGARKGELQEKVTGDAAEVIRKIREAGTLLNLGVIIRTAPGRNGFVNVTWSAKARKQSRKNQPVAE